MYLSAIGLCRNTEEQKLNNEIIWSAIVDNRIHHKRDDSSINIYFKRLRGMSDSFLRGVKRDYHGTFLAPCTDSQTIPLSTALSILNTDSTMFSSGSDSSQLESITIHDSSQSFHPGETIDPAHVESSIHNLESSSTHSEPSRLYVETSHRSGEGSVSGSHSYAHPGLFHVSQRIPGDDPTENTLGLALSIKTEDGKRVMLRNDLSQVTPPHWPGVDAVIESYRRYAQGQYIFFMQN